MWPADTVLVVLLYLLLAGALAVPAWRRRRRGRERRRVVRLLWRVVRRGDGRETSALTRAPYKGGDLWES